MNTDPESLGIEVIDSEEAFIAHKDEWDALIEKSINPSFYATYPFVYTAWKHYHGENDQLFILFVRRGATLVGIAPFRIESMKMGNTCLIRSIRLRMIQFIAEWGGGDKPAIVATEQQESIWNRIFQFLNDEFSQWDGLVLVEQPEDSPVLNQRFLSKIRYFARIVPESTSFYLSLTGTWEEYTKNLGKNTLRTWRKDTKKIFNFPECVKFQCFDNPDSLPDALQRFIALEQSGWKKNSPFSVGGNEKQKAFYEDLLNILVPKNMVAIYFLTSGATDIAAKLIFKCHSKVYSAQVTYNSKFANYSPGVILTAEIIKTFFGTQYKEFDFLGFRNDRKNDAKKNWSTGTRQTITITIYKRNSRMVLYMMGDRLKRSLLNVAKILSLQPSQETHIIEQ